MKPVSRLALFLSIMFLASSLTGCLPPPNGHSRPDSPPRQASFPAPDKRHAQPDKSKAPAQQSKPGQQGKPSQPDRDSSPASRNRPAHRAIPPLPGAELESFEDYEKRDRNGFTAVPVAFSLKS